KMTESYLPRLKLTSFNNLKHARDLVVQLAVQNAELGTRHDELAAQLEAVTHERSALAIKLHEQQKAAAAAHDNALADRQRAEDELREVRAELSQLRMKLSQAAVERSALKASLADLEAKLDRLIHERDALDDRADLHAPAVE